MKFFRVQRELVFVLSGMVLSSDNGDSDSIGSESSGSGSSDESSGTSDEASSLSSVYSSLESSSPGYRDRRYQRRQRFYNDNDYRQIPRRRY